MKAIFFMFLLCCICCLSCSDEQNTLSEEQNVIENKTFEKVSSLELKQQLLDYLNNSVKTRTTFNNAEMNYDLGMQEILRPQIQTFGEEMIVVRSKMDAFGMVTAGAGFVVAVGWCVLQTWLCSSRVVSRPPTEIQIDTIEFKPMERDDDSIARDTIGKLLPLR